MNVFINFANWFWYWKIWSKYFFTFYLYYVLQSTHAYIYIHLFNTHEKLHFEFSTHKMFDDFRSRSFFLILLLFSLRIRACHFVTFIRFASTSKAWGMGSMHVALCPAFTSAIWFREYIQLAFSVCSYNTLLLINSFSLPFPNLCECMRACVQVRAFTRSPLIFKFFYW